MARCPYCTYETPEPDDGDRGVQAWQEVAHMDIEHPDVVRDRIARDGPLDFSARFSEDSADG